MMFYTHVAFSILLSLLTFEILTIEKKMLFLCFAIVFSLLPDIDETRSFFGRILLPLSFLFKLVFGHRKLFHSFIVLAILFFAALSMDFEIALAILIGYGSHLILDMSNTAGITPLYPLSSIKINGFMRTGSWLEKIFFVVLFVAIVFISKIYIL